MPTRSRRFKVKALTLALATCFAGPAVANPQAPTIVAGQATIQQSGKTLNITNTPGAIINWQSFNIDRGELTRFIQQNAQSQVLNRVTGVDPSKILGSLQSNGRVLLINPNGVLFGKDARVDVAGLLVSTLQIKDADFLAGKYKFNDTPGAGKIENQGSIQTASGGQVILIAPQIENSGLIHAPEGQILLAAGKSVTIADPDKPAIQVEITNSEQKAVNLGTLIAKEISIYGGLIKNTGLIQATTAQVGANGKISLRAKYEVENTGTIQANGAIGGDIVIQAELGTAKIQGIVEAKALTPEQFSVQQQATQQIIKQASAEPVVTVNAVNDPIITPDVTGVDYNVVLNAEPTAFGAVSTTLAANWLPNSAPAVQVTVPTGPLAPLAPNPTNPNNPLLPNRQQGQGGSVRVLGRSVRIEDGATLMATGANGGGEILVGGDYQGKNTAIQNAQTTYIAATALLDASALVNGSGGKIIVWSDGTTTVRGSLLARGGSSSGDGGFIETSGHFLQISGILVNAGSSKGGNGRWLLDPSEITIKHGGGSNFGANFSPDGADAEVFDSDINAALNLQTDVVVQAVWDGMTYGTGSVTVNGDAVILNSSGGNRVFTIRADGSINLLDGAKIFGSANNPLGVTLHANALDDGNLANPYFGRISLGAGVLIETFGGSVLLTGGSNPATGFAHGGSGAGIAINDASILAGMGAITLRGSGDAEGINISGASSSLVSASSISLIGKATGAEDTESYGVWVIDGNIHSDGSLNITGLINNAAGVTNSNAGIVIDGGIIEATGGLTFRSDRDIVIAAPLSLNGENILRADVLGSGNGTVIFSGSGSIDLVPSSSLELYYNPTSYSDGATNSTTEGGNPFLNEGYVQGNTSAFRAWMLVNTLAQLQAVGVESKGIYALGRDIDASPTSAWNAGQGFSPIYFQGMFDGLGHTIDRLTINRPTSDDIGLFRIDSSTSTVKNLNLTDATITGRDYVGVVAGISFGTIDNVGVSASVVSGRDAVGGIVGLNGAMPQDGVYGQIINSTADVTLTGTSRLGGIVGFSVIADDIQNSYYNAEAVTINGGHHLTLGGLYSDQFMDWAGDHVLNITDYVTTLPFSSGQYHISTVQGLKDALPFMANASNSFKLDNDLDLSGIPGLNIPLLSGSFDGGGYVISNVSVTQAFNDRVGFIGANLASVQNLHVRGSVLGRDDVGGLIGWNADNVQRSSYIGTVVGRDNVGGLVGTNFDSGSINLSYGAASVSGATAVGGLVGKNKNSISDSFSAGEINAGNSQVGGLIGINYYGVYSSYSITQLNVPGDALIGEEQGSIQNMIWSASLSGTTSSHGSSMSTRDMLNEANWSPFDFNNYWQSDGITPPTLIGLPSPYSVNTWTAGSGVWNDAGNWSAGHVPTANEWLSIAVPDVTIAVMGTQSAKWLKTDNATKLSFVDFNPSLTLTAGGDLGELAFNSGGKIDLGQRAELSIAGVSYTLIRDVSQLQVMNGNLYDAYALAIDIDALATSGWNSGQGFVPIGNSVQPFSGSFNGLGHSINDLTINRPSENNVGLFGKIGVSSHIANVGLNNVNVSGHNNSGSLAGKNEGTISNSYATGNVTGNVTAESVGGLVGSNQGTISRSYATSGVAGAYNNVGGLVGTNQGTISDSFATGSVTGNYSLGGLVGSSDGTIRDSYATGSVIGGYSYVGGLVGFNYATISNSYATGSVTGDSSVGGLVGHNIATISNSYATGSVTGDSSVGGLVGHNLDTISNSYATGSVTGNSSVGGLVGYNDGTISNSYYDIESVLINGSHHVTLGGLYSAQYQDWQTHNLTLDIAYYSSTLSLVDGYYQINSVDGMKDLLGFAEQSSYKFRLTESVDLASIPGYFIPYFAASEFDGASHTLSNLSVNQAFNDNIGMFGRLASGSTINSVGILGASVTASYSVGGLVGFNEGTISNSYATGSVTGNDDVGGLVGINTGTISHSYATGSVTGDRYVGGLVGYNFGTISHSYATGSVTGNYDVGGLLGAYYGTTSDSYWNIETSGQSSSAGGIGLTTAQMKQESSFAGWDFYGTWVIDEGISPPSFGVSVVNDWTGLADNSSWALAGNWTLGHAPTSSERVRITNVPGTSFIDYTGSYTVKSIISDELFSLTASGSHLTLNGSGTFNAGLNLLAGSTLTANGALSLNNGLNIAIGAKVDLGAAASLKIDGNSYILIRDVDQLQAMDNNLSARYALASNINASATSGWNSSQGFVPVGYYGGFDGAFNGLGHSIDNLTINRPSENYIGLFRITESGSQITNVGLINANVTGNEWVGGLVGQNYGTISNSFATGSVTGSSEVGGLVAFSNGTISNSYVTGSVTGDSSVGGLAGNLGYLGTISNSYATGSVTGSSEVGGLVGHNEGTISNSYYDIENVLINGSHHVTQGGLYNTQYQDWQTHNLTLNITDYSSTLPLVNGYYQISSVQGMKDLLGFADQSSYKFRLTTNVDLASAPGYFIPHFAASEFDGASHTLSNPSVNQSFNSYIGMFGQLVSGSTINSVGILGASVTGREYVGGLVGSNYGTISNSYATGSVTGISVGGLVGDNYGTISNSYATVSVTGDSSVGGLVSYNGGTISNSYAAGSVTGSSQVGGLVGDSSGTISNSFYDIDNVLINGSHHVTRGGLYSAQYQDWQTHNLTLDIANYMPLVNGYYQISSVQGMKDLLGFADQSSYKFRLVADIDLTGAAGHFIPYFAASEFDGASHTLSNISVSQAFNDGIGMFGQLASGSTVNNLGVLNVAVTGLSAVGGLVGVNSGAISNSYATGSLSGDGYVGGLVGYNNGTISNSYVTGSVTGSVTGQGNVGGLVGYNYGTISNSYATGSVTGQDYVGGLVGGNEGTIANGFATGAVNGYGYVAGLVGFNYYGADISDSYSTATVVGQTPNTSGLVSINYGSVTRSYWDKEASGVSYSGAGTGLTTAQMKQQASFVGWDFANTWQINEGVSYPTLVTPAVTNYWTGSLSNLWSTGGNWSLGHVPTSSERVQISDLAGISFIDYTGSYTVKSIISDEIFSLTATGSHLTLNGSGTFNNTLNLATGTRLTSNGALLLNDHNIAIGAQIDLGPVATLQISGNAYALIRDVNDLQAMNADLNARYALAGNINATATSGWNSGQGFVPVGSGSRFSGAFNGLGHSIDSLTINRPSAYEIGLFSVVATGSQITNVGLSNTNVSSGNSVGGLAGNNYGTISNSYAMGSVSGQYYVGGLVGYNNGTISNSYATGSVTGQSNVGGLVGKSWGTISKSYATGSVTGQYYVGGLVGVNVIDGTISNSFYDIDNVLINGSHHVTLGGLYNAQYQDWQTHNLTLDIANYSSTLSLVNGYYQISSVQGMKDLLGFADQSSYKFRLAANVDLASATGYFIPHFAASEFDGASHTLSNLSVSQAFNDNIGMFGRLASGSTVNNLGLLNVTVSGQYNVGGLVGYNGGTISNSYATGSVTGQNEVGGLVGMNDGTISNSYATGSVTGQLGAGGLVGSSDGTISNSYATGSVTGQGAVGGLLGHNYYSGTISNSYAMGSVTGQSNVGGLVGYNSGTISNSYWDTQTSGQLSSYGGIGLTSAQMKQQASFAGWDFADIWSIAEGVSYPNFGVINTWTGSADNRYWATAGNWSLGHAPLSTEKVSIPDVAGTSFVELSGNYTVKRITSAEAFTLTASGTSFWLTGGGDFNAGLTLVAGTTLTSDGALTISAAPSLGANAKIDLGASASLTMAGQAYTLIRDVDQLQNVLGDLSGRYALAGNIDAAVTSTWNSGLGFQPLGQYPSPGSFNGVFNGLGHTIDSLTILRPTENYVGLFGWTQSGSQISNLGLTSASVSGFYSVGALVGENKGDITASYSTGAVLAGNGPVGGLVGTILYGSINSSYSTATVSGPGYVGGLVGNNQFGTIQNSFALGSVTGTDRVGGLIGNNIGSVSNSYSAGEVTGITNVGGLLGSIGGGTVTNSYWNLDTSGQLSSAAGTGLSQAGISQSANFVGWDFANTWQAHNGVSSPTLINLPAPSSFPPLVAINVWTGATDNRYWVTAGNWSLGHAPTAAEKVIIPDMVGTSFVELAGNYTVKTLTSAEAFTLTASGTSFWLTKGVSFNAGLTLGAGTTLTSEGALSISAVPTLAIGAKIDLGASASLTMAGQSYTLIRDVTALQGVLSNLGGRYALAGDIDSSATSTWNSGQGFQPLGQYPSPGAFSGVFNGLGHTVDHLTINRPTESYVGLFGWTGGGSQISNVGVTNANISASGQVGALVGENNGVVRSSYSSGTVTGTSITGGLVGLQFSGGSVIDSYSTADVFGQSSTGGLVGSNEGTIQGSYALGSVSGVANIGGLVGTHGGNVSNSFALGSVSGTNNVGGLLGFHRSYASASNNYAAGDVTGSSNAGGLIGFNDGGAVTNSYWNLDTSGQLSSAGGTGLSQSAISQSANFIGWDFANTWQAHNGVSSPTLRNLPAPASFPSPLGTNVWTGLADNRYWATAGNWSFGHAPTASENVSIPNLVGTAFVELSGAFSAKNVVSAELFTLSGAGTSFLLVNGAAFNAGLTVGAGSSLTSNGALTVTSFILNGGALNGSGSFTVTDSFSRTGGTISNLSGVSITQASGNLAPGVLSSIGGAVSLVATSGSLALDSISATSIFGQSGAGNSIALNSGAALSTSASSGNGIVLDAGAGGFVNNSGGATPFSLAGSSRWLVYAADPASVSKNGLTSDFRHYSGSWSAYTPANVTETGSGFVYASAPGVLSVATTLSSGLATHIYGATPTAGFGYNLTGFADSEDNASNVGLTGAIAWSGLQNSLSNVGSYSVAYSTGLSSTAGYTFAAGTGLAYSVAKAHLTVTADNKTRLYGAINPALTTTVSGFVNGETLATSGVTGSGSGTTTATSSTGVGTAAITAGFGTLAASNYDFTTLSNGTLTIDKAHLTVTADNKNRFYGAANPVLSTTVSGFVNGETLATSGVTGSGSGTTTATSSTGVGTAAITAGFGTLAASNYDFTTLSNGTLTIDKAHLTVTADNKNRLYGAINPALTTTVSGFVNGETLATSGVIGSGSGTTTATSSTGVGTAAITAGAGNLTASNYDFTNLVDGTLTIGKAHLTVTADNKTRLYGAINPALTTTVSGFVNGETLATSGVTGSGSGTTTATSSTGVGTAAITAGAGNLTASNYDFTNLVDGTLTIGKAHLTVTADNKTRLYGAINPVLSTTVSGFVNGETLATSGVTGSGSGTTTATSSTGVGTATITAGFGTLAASNYDFTTLNNGTLTIDKAHLTVTAASASKTYDGLAYSGGNGVAYSGFVNSETASVLGGTLSYGGTAQGAANAGSYTLTATGLTSGNYNLNYAGGTLVVDKRLVTAAVSGTVSKEYDATMTATLGSQYSLNNVVAGDTGALSLAAITGNYANKDAGTGKLVSFNVALSGTAASNYQLVGTTLTSNSAVITPKALATWTGTAGDGSWRNAANWQGGVAPEAANVLSAFVPAGNGNIIYDMTRPTTLLSLDSARSVTLTNSSELTLGAALSDVSTMRSGATLTVQGGDHTLNGTLDALGFVLSGGRFAGAGVLNLAANSQLAGGALSVATTNNLAGSQLDVVANTSLNSRLNNAGVVSVAGGTTFSVAAEGVLSTLPGGIWSNAGTVNVLGSVDSRNQVSSYGTVEAQDGAVFNFASGTWNFANGSRFAGLGSFTNSGAALNLTGAGVVPVDNIIYPVVGTSVAPETALDLNALSFAGVGNLTNLGVLSANNLMLNGSLTNKGTFNALGTVGVAGLYTDQVAGSLVIPAGSNFRMNNPAGLFRWSGGVLGNPNGAAGTLGFDNGASFQFAGNGDRVIDGMNFNFTDLTLPNGSVTVRSGSLTLDGTSTIPVGVGLNVSGGRLTNNGQLNVAGNFNLNAGIFDGAGGINMQGGTMSRPSSSTIRWLSTGSLVNTGNLNFGGGTITNAIDNRGSGTIVLGAGTTFTQAFSNAGELQVGGGSTLFQGGYTQSSGLLKLTGGDISGNVTLNGGSLGGSGTINGNLVVGTANFTPGFSPGTITVNGNFVMSPSSVLTIELGGLAQGSGYDFINVLGTANLAGTLNVNSWGGYVAAPGSNYTFMNFGSSTGSFAAVNLPNGWNISLGSYLNSLQLSMANLIIPPVPVAVPLVSTLSPLQALIQAMQQNGMGGFDPMGLAHDGVEIGLSRVMPNDLETSLAQMIDVATQVQLDPREFEGLKQCH